MLQIIYDLAILVKLVYCLYLHASQSKLSSCIIPTIFGPEPTGVFPPSTQLLPINILISTVGILHFSRTFCKTENLLEIHHTTAFRIILFSDNLVIFANI